MCLLSSQRSAVHLLVPGSHPELNLHFNLHLNLHLNLHFHLQLASPATCTRCVPQQQYISQHMHSIYSQITRQKINLAFKIIYSSLFKQRLTFINSARISVFLKKPCHSQSQLQPSCSTLLLGGLNPASKIVHSQLPYRFLMLKLRQLESTTAAE